MTAALIHSLELLGKQQLEATPGLFPSLLSGVSARLDSPEGPIRQEQRVTRRLHVHAAHSLQPCKFRVLIPVYMLYNWERCQARNALIKRASKVSCGGSTYGGLALVSCLRDELCNHDSAS